MSGVYLEDLCFDAQQSPENAIKAVFVHRGIIFPHVHDFARLLRLLERNGLKVPKYGRKAAELTSFAWEARYPGDASPVTPRQHQRAVRIAKAVLRWAERQIGKP